MDGFSRSRRLAPQIALWLLGLALLVSSLAFGGVQTWSLAVAGALVAGAAVAASVASPRTVRWPTAMALAVAVVAGLQAVPLPMAVLSLLTPKGGELLSLSLGTVTRHAVSLDPAATAREFARLSVYALALFTASRLASEGGRSRQLLLLAAGLVLVQCGLAVAHKVVATDAIYGIHRPLQQTNVLTSFGNANFLTAFLTLGVPPLLVLGLLEEELGPRLAWIGCALFASLLVLLTGSRSGFAGLLVALVVLGVAIRPWLEEVRWLPRLVGAALAAGVVATFWADPSKLAKFELLLRPGAIGGDIKVRAWRDVPALIADYWRAGVGRGAFETVFPGYKHVAEQLVFTHAEDAPLQVLADFGVPLGLAILAGMVAAVALGLREARRAPGRERLVRYAAGAAAAGLLVHEIGDFSLDMATSVGLLLAVLLGVLWPAVRPDEEPRGWQARRWARVGAVAGLAGVAGAALSYGAHYEVQREVRRIEEAARDRAATVEPLVREAIGRHPAEPWLPFMAGVDRVAHARPVEALPYLNRALLLDPSAWRPHVVLGQALLAIGRTGQGLLELRLAFVISGYESAVVQALDGRRDVPAGEVLRVFAAGGPEVVRNYARYLDARGRDAELLPAGLRLLELVPGDGEAERLLARLEARRHGFAAVLEHVKRLPPDDPEVVLLRVQALDGLGRGSEADQVLEEADRRSGGAALPATVARLLAERALARRQGQAVLALLDRAKMDDLGPEELARLHHLRALAYELEGHVRDAVREGERMARIHPCETTWLALGDLYERLGLKREALLVYRGAVRSMPQPGSELRERLARLEPQFRAPTLSGGTTGERPTVNLGLTDDVEDEAEKAKDDDEQPAERE